MHSYRATMFFIIYKFQVVHLHATATFAAKHVTLPRDATPSFSSHCLTHYAV